MAEPVRLLIWDLDETFWRGTLSEGGVAFVERNEAIVVELARRGIVSSICSKNDFDSVKTRLVERGLWDYFVAPSVSWEPKGPRIRELIETIGLRPATAMFVDDIEFNREEARRFCPDLRTCGPEALETLLANPLFRGKDDRDLSRLKQYKALERRNVGKGGAGDDLIRFLRESRIEVEIETDVEAHIDRFIELINRTNQLNFTKQRLPEDAEAARRDVRALLKMYQKQAALVRVRDRYGDHGFCGAYVHNSEGRRLEQFAFSCRILGLGVERWLYQKLGRPRIEVKGEVLADLNDPAPIDWIAQRHAGEASDPSSSTRIGRITARGSCDIGAIVHYFRYHSDDAVGEYHIFRNGGVFRIEHSVFLHHGAHGLTPAQMQAARRLGYVETDFQTRIYEPAAFDAAGHLVLLGFGADVTQPLLRHRGSGLIAPFTAVAPGWSERDITEMPEAETPPDFPPWAREALQFVRAEWDYLGTTRPRDFEALLRFAVGRIPASAKVCLLAFLARDYLHKDGVVRKAPPYWEPFNAAMRAVAAAHPNVAVIELDDLLEDREIDDRLHFHRGALFRIYRRICEIVFPAEAP